MHNVYFLFVGEGVTDNSFVRPLETLCILCGAAEATGTILDWQRLPDKVPRSVLPRVRAALQLEPSANLIFVHRDADAPDAASRRDEITGALDHLELEIPGIPVVPVQATESWLLLDEASIRRVAENPGGRMPLDLPKPRQIEGIADPKTLLNETLVKASDLQGRRLKKFRSTLPDRIRLLLDRLDPEGPVNELSAWQKLRTDLEQALRTLGIEQSSAG